MAARCSVPSKEVQLFQTFTGLQHLAETRRFKVTQTKPNIIWKHKLHNFWHSTNLQYTKLLRKKKGHLTVYWVKPSLVYKSY